MPSQRLCFFNLTENFHTFFLALTRRMEDAGAAECYFFNFWPGEIASLRKNGFAGRLVEWKKDFPQQPERIDSALLDKWIGTDPRYLATPEERKPAEKKIFRTAASHLLPLFRRVAKEYGFDAVFFWNGYRFPEPVFRTVCEEEGIATLFGENGFFGHTMQIDTEGINAACSLRRRPAEEWFDTAPEGDPRFAEFLRTGGNLPPSGKPLPPAAQISRAERLQSAASAMLTERAVYTRLARKSPLRNFMDNTRIRRERRSRPTSRNAALPEKYLFLPFQVHDDTQIVIHSPWVDSMRRMVEAVTQARDRLGLPHRIVVKEHPVDVGRYDFSTFPRSEDIVWLWDFPLDKALAGADCVITVNSSVGVEAAVRGLPVVTLGNALYNVPGVVHHAAGEAELPERLQAALETPPEEERRHRFLYKLRFRDMVEASWGKPTEEGVAAAAGRIEKLLAERTPAGTG